MKCRWISAAHRRSRGNSATVTKVVFIGVRRESASWNSRTLAEIEEQVERTQLHHTRPLGVLILILAVAVFVLAAQFLNFAATPLTSTDWWLKHSDLDRLAEMLKQHPTLTNEDFARASNTAVQECP